MQVEKRRYIKSSSFAMAMLFTILCGGVALCLGYFINYFTTGHFVQSTQAALDAEIRYIQTQNNSEKFINHDNIIYLPLDEIDDKLKANISPLSDGIVAFDDLENGKKYAAKIHTLSDGKGILVGLDITEISNDFKFMQIMGVSSILFVMVVVFVSYIISVFVVSNTNKIAYTAKRIMETGDLSRRVEIDSRWDDLSHMAVVLNQLLDRIQDLMRGVRHVSDNIAHDLRTPLTRLHNKIEELEKTSTDAQYTQLKQETDNLLNVFNALLRISRIETERQKSQFETINIKKIINDVIDFYMPLIQDKDIQLEVSLCDWKMHGDRDLLSQVYANILDNAVKFTPEQGRIVIKMMDNDIRISNSFDCDITKEVNQLFDRFYRADKSRNTEGTGLGLSLVKAVVELHSGTVKIENNQNTFVIITSL